MPKDKSSEGADERPIAQSELDRLDRQGAALRANLKKRKRQSSARKAPITVPDALPAKDPNSDTEKHD
ncbi:hypothetical protein [Magnetovibrio blakemorei]|uniref:Uncharacterized protein n=1 Tax=Magnetovibrio blakemorei TaxID=28181 RepID=A0A1E5Q7Y6_9PROT|nr:hypothetical protein [Magnetovibrio blakemorei]OEJ67185.1 hypothetical protein BEN30_10455 [Magnetovibrio blakemorei]